MLSVGRPHRDALLSPLPRGMSSWGTLNSPTSLQSFQAMVLDTNIEEDDFRSSSSRAETPSFTYAQRRRLFTRSTGSAGGVLLIDPARVSPVLKPKSRDDSSAHSIFALDSQPGESSANSPPLTRKKGDISTLKSHLSRPQSSLSQHDLADERIRSVAELEGPKSTTQRSSYQSPAVETVEDVFYTGVATPEPPSATAEAPLIGSGGGGLDGLIRSIRAAGKQTLAPAATELSYRRPSPILEDAPECYTPTPGPRGTRNVHPLSSKQETPKDSTPAMGNNSVSAKDKQDVSPALKSGISPSTLLRLKYPTSHSATIEIQHTEGIKISGGGNGSAKIAIQVDLDNAHTYGYTSTIKTGRKGGMTVTVRPTSANSYRNANGGTTIKEAASDEKDRDITDRDVTEVIHHFEEGEDEVIIAPTPRRRKSRSKHRSHKSHHNGIAPGTAPPNDQLPYPQTPPPHRSTSLRDASSRHHSLAESVNLIDLHSSTPAPSSSAVSSPRRTVRKMVKSMDLKVKEMESPILPRYDGNHDIFGHHEEQEQEQIQDDDKAQQQRQEEEEDGFEWDEPTTPPSPAYYQNHHHHHHHHHHQKQQFLENTHHDEFDGGPVILGGRKGSNSATTAILIRKRESGQSGKSGSGGSRGSRGSKDIRPLSLVGLPMDFASSMGVKDVEEEEQQQEQLFEQHELEPQQIEGRAEIEGGWI
ncbi:hypothetical protein DFH27DRAFT_550752 [Peziza echinospora]|nr:hypothetical protein DFH27DRAFT_550752 [Peziza echinospora]